jgi:hypothetical protein
MTHNSPKFLASAASGAAMQRPPGIAPLRAAPGRDDAHITGIRGHGRTTPRSAIS